MKLRSGGLLLAAISLVVGVAVVSGFLVIGSPREERLRDLDRQRVERLRELSEAIKTDYYEKHAGERALPAGIEGDSETPQWFRRHADPVTGKPFEYRRLAADRFALCATFDAAREEKDLEPWEEGWSHPKGRACFEFRLRDWANGPNGPNGLRPSASPALPPTRPSGAR